MADSETLLEALRTAEAGFDESPAHVLRRLVAAWGIVRAPAIADAIDLASKPCAQGLPSLAGGQAAHVAEWERVAKLDDPADVDRLVASLRLRDAEGSTARLKLLRARTPNPRLAPAIERHLDDAFGGTPSGRAFWRALGDTLVELEDRRVGDTVRVPMRADGPRLRAQVAKRWTEPPRALDEAEAATLERIVGRLQPRVERVLATQRDGVSLLAAVYAAPAEDGPRLVYGDWLTEQGDARGEFITLQFERHAGTISRASAARERKLLDQHYKAWLGRIAPHFRKDAFRFERGFLGWARVADVPRLDAPEWSTCRELNLPRATWTADGVLYALSASDLPGLEVLTGLTSEGLGRLVTGKNAAGQRIGSTRLTALRRRLTRLAVEGRPDAANLDGIEMPSLRDLEWTGRGAAEALFATVLRGPLAQHVERVAYTDVATRLGVALERDGDRLSRVRVTRPIDDLDSVRPGLEGMCSRLGVALALA